jgi:hypothetical protein
MNVKERIQFYKDQGFTEPSELLHQVLDGLCPDEVNKYHDELCELTGNKTITNPKVIEAIEAAERGETTEFTLPNPDEMIIGFTGSRKGINQQQADIIKSFLLENEATHLHHGDCVGADTSFHEIGEELNLSISIHPPDKKGLRSFCKPKGEGISHEEKPFIKRNHDIVNACDFLIACPETSKEVQRSGTWATIRYARKQGKEVRLIPSKE